MFSITRLRLAVFLTRVIYHVLARPNEKLLWLEHLEMWNKASVQMYQVNIDRIEAELAQQETT